MSRKRLLEIRQNEYLFDSARDAENKIQLENLKKKQKRIQMAINKQNKKEEQRSLLLQQQEIEGEDEGNESDIDSNNSNDSQHTELGNTMEEELDEQVENHFYNELEIPLDRMPIPLPRNVDLNNLTNGQIRA